jgi:ketosteroid isomerase-like protein
MLGWATRWMIRRNVRRLNDGDYAPLLSGYTKDAVLVFPGENSWAGEHRGRDAIEKFLQRFVRVGIKVEIHEILLNGPPWNTKTCVRFSDSAKASDGTVFYKNTGVIYGTIAWGKIKLQHDFEDTERVSELDRYRAAHPEIDLAAAKGR